MNLLEKLFDDNKKQISKVNEEVDIIRKQNTVSGISYGFVECTLSEAQAFTTLNFEVRFITNARKSGEGVGLGTGLPAFYDASSSSWLDFTGSVIQV